MLVSLVREGNCKDFFIGDYTIGSLYYVLTRKDLTRNRLSDDTLFSFVILLEIFLSLMYEFYNISFMVNGMLSVTPNDFFYLLYSSLL